MTDGRSMSSFFKAPFYDREVVQWAEDSTQPAALMEEISIQMTKFSSPGFTGPVMLSLSKFHG